MGKTAPYTFTADVVFAHTLLERRIGKYPNINEQVPDGFYKWADDQIQYVGFYKKRKKDPVGNVTCTHCHNTFLWTKGINSTNSPFETTCPHCGKRLECKSVSHAQFRFDTVVYAGLHCIINGIDCVRVFRKYVHEDVRVLNQEHRYSERRGWNEDTRLWHGPNGEKLCTHGWMYGYRYVDINTESLTMQYVQWKPVSYLSYSGYYHPEDLPIHTTTMVLDYTSDPHLPILKACLTTLKSKAILHRVIERVYDIPMIETLVKAGHLKAAGYVANRSFERGKYETETRQDCDNPNDVGCRFIYVHHIDIKDVISALKICLRHKYDYGKIEQYVDYLDKVFMAGLDMRSPKYICPEDRAASEAMIVRRLNKMDEPRRLRMAEWNARREERDAIRDAARRAEQAKRDEMMREFIETGDEAYKYYKQEFLDIKFKTADGRLSIHVLQSVDEFRDEGKHMHHCVYQNGYYKNLYSLILSCRNASTRARVSTIELRYDKETHKISIAQNRAACNQHPQDYKLINETITAHFDEFIDAFIKMDVRLTTAKAEKAAAAKRTEEQPTALAV